MIATACVSLEDHDPIVLELLRLAAETILAHPAAVPPDLAALVDAWAADLNYVLVAGRDLARDDSSRGLPGPAGGGDASPQSAAEASP